MGVPECQGKRIFLIVLAIAIDSRGIQRLAHVDEVKVIKKAISTKQFD